MAKLQQRPLKLNDEFPKWLSMIASSDEHNTNATNHKLS